MLGVPNVLLIARNHEPETLDQVTSPSYLLAPAYPALKYCYKKCEKPVRATSTQILVFIDFFVHDESAAVPDAKNAEILRVISP